MNIISNVEFEKLVTDQSSRLKMIAKQRCDQAPNGFLTLDEIGHYTKACMHSGDRKAVQWLKSLVVLAKNGKLARIRNNALTWEDHIEDVHIKYAAKEIPFDIGQHVFVKDVGRYGSIADYVPDTQEYIVVLDPFQILTYKKKDLEKVAQLEKMPPDSIEHLLNQEQVLS